jgi:ubiquinone/menaquinone biosynthesis C-methylase UbiE
MPEKVTLLRVFVSSPGDVGEERQVLEDVVRNVNAREAIDHGVILQLWKWEEDALRRIGPSPQQVIDEQLPKYDVYLGILGGRFGTPTGTYGSGTEKEFHDALGLQEKGILKWILFYFRTATAPPKTQQDLQEYGRVLAFKESIQQRGLYHEYSQLRGSDDAFMECVERDLRRIVTAEARPEPPPVPGPLEPDVEASEVDGSSDDDQTKVPDEEKTDVQPTTKQKKQFGYFEPTTALDERDQVIERARRAAFEVISPAYLLDRNFHFLDWNTAFEELVAKPLELNRKNHALEFIQRLDNCGEVIKRSQGLFGYNKKNPIVDVEPLIFRSAAFGLVRFRKIAAQIIDRDGTAVAWIVTLNIEHADKSEELWSFLQKHLTEDFNWTRYAVSYDRLLMPFRANNDLLAKVVDMVGAARLCVDLGAGTGNGTVRLLESDRDRIVWAIDSNEGMLQYLRAKVHERSKDDPSILNRLTTVKGNVERLTELKGQAEFFDAAIMVNVLYSVDDPLTCLKRAGELLKPAGILVLTTSHSKTDVRKLFQEMRRDLTEQGLFNSLSDLYEEAKQVHKRMDYNIHRDSIEMIHDYLDKAGFDIEHEEPEYVDSVVLIKASKREEW